MVNDQGVYVPVTVLKVELQKVTKTLTVERDGYDAYQVGCEIKAKKNLTKADLARMEKASIEEAFSRFQEFRTGKEPSKHQVGDVIGAGILADIGTVDITGVTKGRGFQGAVRRFGATIGRMTHGSRFHRRPGSLGMRSTPGRVFKNKHQPGHMGVDQRTVQNLSVMKVDVEQNIIAVKGSVPGHRNAIVQVFPARGSNPA